MSKFVVLVAFSFAFLLTGTLSASAYAGNFCGGFMSWPCPAGQHCQHPNGGARGYCVPNKRTKR
jgi:hypothetical protein